MIQVQPDLFSPKPKVVKVHHSEGQRRKRDGQFANLISKATWHHDALSMLRRWLRQKRRQGSGAFASDTFTMEPFKAWALANGLEAPKHHNCWGVLTTAANSIGLIEWTHTFDIAKSPTAHGRAIKVWRKGPQA
jgi:hypothetical protein